MITETDLSSVDNQKRIIPSLDVAKFVCAVLVVMVHTMILLDINKYTPLYNFSK